MKRPTKCAVLGCDSVSTKDLSIRFFKFPKVSKKFGDTGKLWREFTRKKGTTSLLALLCSLHFAPEYLKLGPKGRTVVKKGAVPTIYYSNGQKIVVPFNKEFQKYYGPEAEKLFEETEKACVDHEKELINLRYKKVCDLKILCRFCFMNRKESTCIEMSALNNYSIDPNDIIKAIGCGTPYSIKFSELICEDCFLKILEVEKFRKKCCEKQQGMLNELEELDKKILQVQQSKRKSNNNTVPWYKVESNQEPDEFKNSIIFNSITSDLVPLDQSFETEKSEVAQVNIKQEPEVMQQESDDDFNDFDDTGAANYDSDDGSDDFALINYKPSVKVEEPRKEEVNVKSEELPNIQETPPETEELSDVQETSKTTAKSTKSKPRQPKPPKPESKPKRHRETLKHRIYECFFCHTKTLGKQNARKHKCLSKFRMCEAPGCGKKFTHQGNYSNHLISSHGLPKISAHYCPGCMTYYQMNIYQFQDHTRSCEKNKEAPEQEIKCDRCYKLCPNLEAYTAHKLFHGTMNLIETVDETGQKVYRKRKPQKERICDLCGKVFIDCESLRKHKVNVHLIEFTGQMYYCDLCPVKKPTRRLIFDHLKSVHVIDWHRCPTCGKDFKSRRLLARHILYMHERHRLNIRCNICPDKPGFSAKIYLDQHMRKQHGENSAPRVGRFRCDFGFCEASYASQKTLDQHKMNMHGFYQYYQ
ncbi:zinc finger and BTB domain-containing protein 11-like [Chironomus tepperi]|uniref:zinc finger and BTB domain-containing protein 11-like n=1 Tax=Chironomus tepperi TaxID=113505 RepID=UPI00391F1104